MWNHGLAANPVTSGFPAACRRAWGTSKGMTLVEILVVIAIVAILAALAIPSYSDYLQRGERAEAVRTLLEMAACQERIRAASGYYDTNNCPGNNDKETYLFRYEPAGKTGTLAYTAIASPASGSPGDGCGSLSLDQSGTRAISGAAERLSACWGGR